MKITGLRKSISPLSPPMVSNLGFIACNYEWQPISIPLLTLDSPNGFEAIQMDVARQENTILTNLWKIWRHWDLRSKTQTKIEKIEEEKGKYGKTSF